MNQDTLEGIIPRLFRIRRPGSGLDQSQFIEPAWTHPCGESPATTSRVVFPLDHTTAYSLYASPQKASSYNLLPYRLTKPSIRGAAKEMCPIPIVVPSGAVPLDGGEVVLVGAGGLHQGS
jgi:hypothetical protein